MTTGVRQQIRRPIPAFINPQAGSADEVTPALARHGAFELHQLGDPARLPEMVRAAAANGATRVVISGGDGTLATGAAAARASGVEMAIIPGGTLNHFAKAFGIPTDPEEAARIALVGEARPVDVAFLDDQLILNTSSVGGYVTFVRVRERLERVGFPYLLASLIASGRVLLTARRLAVAVEVDGTRRLFRTPLVFVAVGERELSLPTLGGRLEHGRRGLHVIVIRGRTRTSLLLLGLALTTRGLRGARALGKSAGQSEGTRGVESFLVDRLRIETRRRSARVAVDGEVLVRPVPIEYRYARDALRLVMPLDSTA